MDTELSASAEAALRKPDPELLESLRILNNSQALLRTILLGTAMQYRSLDVQRQLLLSRELEVESAPCGPSPQEIQTAASLLVIYALLGFQQQAERLARQEAALHGGCADLTDVKLGATVILVSLIRLARLNRPVCPAGNPREQAGFLETEELTGLPEL